MAKHFQALQLILSLLCLCADFGCCNKRGANPAVCNQKDMKPRHTEQKGYVEDGSGKFKISLTSYEYDPSEPKSITVTLKSSIGKQFKGFIIQARQYDSFDYIAKGVLEGPPTLTGQVCGRSGNAVTHNSAFSNVLRSSISMSWSPPPDVCEAMKMGDLHFQASVVEQYTTPPHIKIFSQVLKMSNNTAKHEEACRKQRGSAGTAKLCIIVLFMSLLHALL